MLKQLHNADLFKWVNFALLIFLIFAYFGRPLPIVQPDNQQILSVIGRPAFINLIPTKSSGSGVVFKVSDTIFYCGIGVTQGENDCGFDNLIDKKSSVTVKYFLMPTRLGSEYPLVLSIEQEGLQKVSYEFMYEMLRNSYKRNWNQYFILLIFFGSIAAFLCVVELLKGKNEK